MSVRRGEIVRVDWPYSDRTGSKVRPVLVVQEDTFNHLLTDTVLVLISRTPRAVGVTEVEIDPAMESQSGLRYRSIASCTNLLTIDQGLIVQTIGRLSVAAMAQIDTCLKKTLGLT
jgi:mRNA-degrading endonuclease toxin of MazEF toxin-antitoxin module